MLSVWTLGFIFLEEIRPCEIEMKNFSVSSSVRFENFDLLLVFICFTLVDFPCRTRTPFLA